MRIGILLREVTKSGRFECFNTILGVPKDIIDICRGFNVTPVLLTHACGMSELIEETDGIIIPGSSLPMSDLREYPIDKEVLGYYLRDGKPVFGICGGMQELCVALGGNVVCDEAEGHMGSRHSVELRGIFKNIFGSDAVSVNSYHNNYCVFGTNVAHCVVSMNAGDNILEGFMDGNNIAVQWHPEVMEAEHYRRIFEYFFRRCNDSEEV